MGRQTKSVVWTSKVSPCPYRTGKERATSVGRSLCEEGEWMEYSERSLQRNEVLVKCRVVVEIEGRKVKIFRSPQGIVKFCF